MRVGILILVLSGAKYEKIQIQNTQNRFLQIFSSWVVLNQSKTS